ncbi:hypothetical protein P6P90_07930 [Ectobacillus antri]|jgi:hypothetical protein|uniref:Uncharacterized protein n=1 Tax=Ectobacillus antri TaxID=2486280 RepID=A0ABT6H3D0_9BACI|nr:hypothetical protein [Ectobacillus antri]MDG4656737.1 hypothetical protein [Ectobacillus antri]MDG5753900.1 hypothetical protein [Ectobacillus antri]
MLFLLVIVSAYCFIRAGLLLSEKSMYPPPLVRKRKARLYVSLAIVLLILAFLL